MAKKLRINNLSDDTTVQDLRTLFGGVGTVARAKISREEETGVSKGYGFVEMETIEGLRTAITTLNGRTLKGKEIRVLVVRPPSEGRKPGDRPRPTRAT